MDPSFQYRTINSETEGIYKDRGSKFIAYLHPVQSIEDIHTVLEYIKSEHPKARHVCYAYRLGLTGEPHRINDDGEPSGTAGRPIFNELLRTNISDVICAVVRYFGGTKLGVPGLIAAYRGATAAAITVAEIKKVTLTKQVMIYYRMENMGRIYNILKQRGYSDIVNHYEPTPHLEIQVALIEIGTIRATILADFLGYGVGDISDDFECGDLRVVVE